MSDFALRQCCRAGGSVMLDFGPSNHPGAGPIVGPAVAGDLAPDPATAWHEAAHVAAGVALGMVPDTVFAGSLGYVRWSGIAPTGDAQIVATMAGDYGALLRHRIEDRPPDAALKPWLDLVREPAGGGCDRCMIFRSLVHRHGLMASDARVMADFRRLELATLEILRDSRVRRAIRELAEALMEAGRLSGPAALEIVARHLEPGEFLPTLENSK